MRGRLEEALAEHADQKTLTLMILLVFEADVTNLRAEIWIVHCQPEQKLEILQKQEQLYEVEAPVRIDAEWTMKRKGNLPINSSTTVSL